MNFHSSFRFECIFSGVRRNSILASEKISGQLELVRNMVCSSCMNRMPDCRSSILAGFTAGFTALIHSSGSCVCTDFLDINI